MPIYEYQCEKCGTFEATQRIIEKPLSKCPTCKGKVKKLISNTSFQLKGTGWYVTDYARKDQNGSKTENGASASAKEKKNDTKESKTEAKKEPAAAKTESSSTSTSST